MTPFHIDPAWFDRLVAEELAKRERLSPEQAEALVLARLRYRRLAAYCRRTERNTTPQHKRKGGRI